MDIHMPGMNGLEATKEIMIESPTPIVIVSASSRAQEVETTMKALKAGALTVLLKPSGPSAPNFQAIAKDIVDTVRAMSDVIVIRHRRPRLASTVEMNDSFNRTSCVTQSRIQVIAVAASTGGPPALAKVLGQLPSDFPVPVLLVQHIVPAFVEGFASWLDSVVPLQVRLACDHERIEAGTVYVAPSNVHLGVSLSHRIRLSDAPPIDGFQPAANFLFDSVAENYKASAAGVILTGMGHDGAQGIKHLHSTGAATIAQDETTSVVFGMPRVAIEMGVIDIVLPIDKIASHLVRLIGDKISAQD
jgi:two-component system chemotaxis response regulator CheB